jgi:hypothetical protein
MAADKEPTYWETSRAAEYEIIYNGIKNCAINLRYSTPRRNFAVRTQILLITYVVANIGG